MEAYLEQPGRMPSVPIPEVNSSSEPEDEFFEWLNNLDTRIFQGFAEPESKDACTEQPRSPSPSPLIEFMESLSPTKLNTFSEPKSSVNLEPFSQPDMPAHSSSMGGSLAENHQSLGNCEPAISKRVTEPEEMDTCSVQSGSISPSQLTTFTEPNSLVSASSQSYMPVNSCTTEDSLIENSQSLGDCEPVVLKGIAELGIMKTHTKQHGSTLVNISTSSQPISSVEPSTISQPHSTGNSSTTGRSLSGNSLHLDDYEPATLKGIKQSEVGNTHAQQTGTTPSSHRATLIKVAPYTVTESNSSASASSQSKSSAIASTFSQPNVPIKFNTTEESLSGNSLSLIPWKQFQLKGVHTKQDGSIPKSSALQVQVPKLLMKRITFNKSGPRLLSSVKPTYSKYHFFSQPNASSNSLKSGESSAESSRCLSDYKPTSLKVVVKTEVMTAPAEKPRSTPSLIVCYRKPEMRSKQSISSQPVFLAMPSTHSLTRSSSVSSQPASSAMPITHSLSSSSTNPNTTVESVTDYSALFENYRPGIPNNVVSNLVQTAGLQTTNPVVVKLISAASEKFMSNHVNGALQHSKMRPSTSDSKKRVLKMEDLIPDAEEFAIKIKKPRYFAP